MSYFLVFSSHFNRDAGLDAGRLSLNSLDNGTIEIWVAASSTDGKQEPENFHNKGGMIPPQYRCGIKHWVVSTKPIYMPAVKGVNGNFYKIDPHEVKTDKGGIRGDFGVHLDANAPGSLGCIVLNAERFKSFETRMNDLNKKGITSVKLFVQYS